MNSRIIVAAILALTASSGAAYAEIAPSYNTNEVCAVGVAVDPRFCVDYVGPPLGVDTVVTGGVERRVLPGLGTSPASDALPEAEGYIMAPNAGGHVMPWTSNGNGLLVEVITP
jgi:hypothetical protein